MGYVHIHTDTNTMEQNSVPPVQKRGAGQRGSNTKHKGLYTHAAFHLPRKLELGMTSHPSKSVPVHSESQLAMPGTCLKKQDFLLSRITFQIKFTPVYMAFIFVHLHLDPL